MLKSKFEQYKDQYPDAREYYEKTQGFVPEQAARIILYGDGVEAKMLFELSIPRTTGVVQQYIFSEAAAKEELKSSQHVD